MADAGKAAKVISEAAEGAAKAASNKKLIDALKTFKKNLVQNSVTDNYINRAVSWAIYGAGIGGVIAWTEGDSFWEGAKRGALKGALAGAGYTAYKAGRGIPDFTVTKIPGATKIPGVSDQVTAIIRNEANSKLAIDALGLYGGASASRARKP